jgi:D-alanyl-D-alanine carboxypeptidase
MFERLSAPARTAVHAGQDEARQTGSPVVEAEHLLLAVSALEGDPARLALDGLGLDHGRLRELLREERTRSLAYAGVDASAFPGPDRSLAAGKTVRFATSAKAALARAVSGTAGRGGRTIDSTDLLVALLLAERGTVPRMIELARLDRAEIVARLMDGRAA